MRIRKNYKGESLDGVKKQLSDPLYGTGKLDEYGEPEINWGYYITGNADGRGFDKDYKEINGKYCVKVCLPKSTVIIRYGYETGHYTAPKGTLYEELAMPYVKETLEYNEYEVIADNIVVFCEVTRGKVAVSRDCKKGGIQYHHEETILQLIKKGVLRRL